MLRLFNFFLGRIALRFSRNWKILSLFALLNGLIEVATLGLLALFVASLTSLGDVLSSRYIIFAQSVVGEYWFSAPKIFYMTLGGITIALVVLKNIFVAIHYYFTSRFEGAVNRTIGLKMLKGFMQAPYAWSSTQNSADVQSYVEWRLFVGFFMSQSMTLVGEAAVSLLLILVMFCFEPLVTLAVAGVALGAGVFFFCVFKRKINFCGRVVSDAQKEGDKISLMNIQGLRDIVTFNVREPFLHLFEQQVDRFAWGTAWQRLYARAPMLSLESFGLMGVVGGAITMVSFSEYTTARLMGTLSLVAVSAWRILPALNRSIVALGAIQSYRSYLYRVKTFIQDLERLHAWGLEIDVTELPPLREEIRIDRLTYKYEGGAQEALSNLEVSIPKGAMVGIIGHSGAGKSTLTDVLTGLLSPTEGAVLIDGVPLTNETKLSWRDRLGLIPQKPYFFDGSIAQNVAFSFSDEEIDTDKVWKCLQQAGAESFVRKLPDALDGRVGADGNQLSGGQGQRLAIARALYKEPQVLIFDEATSSLDERNAKKIREIIFELRGEKTIIIVAHRLRAVQDCDQIIWLENGEIVEIGSPETILPKYTESEVETEIISGDG